MKRLTTLEIYNLVAIIIIIGLTVLCYKLYHNLKETVEILNMCDYRYYELVKKNDSINKVRNVIK